MATLLEEQMMEDSSRNPENADTTETCTTNDSEEIKTDTEQYEEKEGEWLDILGNGQLRKKVLTKGDGSAGKPRPGCTVVVSARATLPDGQVVDQNDSLTFTLGEGEALKGLDIAVTLMERGERSLVEAAPRFFYGEQGRHPDVPPNATLSYQLELVSVAQHIEPSDLEEPQLLAILERKRAWGNRCFERKEFEEAVNCFQKAGVILDEYCFEKKQNEVVRQWTVTCWNNLAASLIKLDLLKKAEEALKKVLKIDPTNPKAVYRMSKVLSSRGEYRSSVSLVKKAVEAHPDEKALTAELERVEKLKQRSADKEKVMYRRMIDGLGKKDHDKPRKTKTKSPSTTMSVWPYVAFTAAAVAVVGCGLAYLLNSKH